MTATDHTNRAAAWVPPSRWPRFVMYPLLALMALADGYAFWITLDVIIGKDKLFLLVIVIALSLGAVVGAHEIGRLARRRREGGDASIAWMAALTAVWMLVGAIIAWIRAHQSLVAAPTGFGMLQVAQPTGLDPQAVMFAVLLLGLYLLTGGLAATHAYRFGDPRSAELREATSRWQKLARERARRAYELQRAEGLLQQQLEEQQRAVLARNGRAAEAEAWRAELYAHEAEEMARHLHDPAATDAVARQARPAGGMHQAVPLQTTPVEPIPVEPIPVEPVPMEALPGERR